MILAPCHHCAHKMACPIWLDIHEKLSTCGVRLTKASFRCDERLKGFEVGREVTVSFRDCKAEPYDGEFWYWTEPITGTIYDHTRDRKVRIWLDAYSPRGKAVVNLYPDYPGLTVTGGRRPACEECSRPAGSVVGDTWSCSRCERRPREGADS